MALNLTVPSDNLVDVVILGDGYTTESWFRAQLDLWLRAFFALRVYNSFAGAFRIRALFTPSKVPASPDRGTLDPVSLTDSGSGVAKDRWWNKDDGDGGVFRRRLWESIDSFDDVHLRRYSSVIDIGNQYAVPRRAPTEHLPQPRRLDAGAHRWLSERLRDDDECPARSR